MNRVQRWLTWKLWTTTAKKQAEFEEEYAQRNAIHRLDNDEIDYLEGLLKKERETEALVRSEVEQGLNQFKQKRQQQEGVEGDDTTKKMEKVNAYVPSVVKRRKKNTEGVTLKKEPVVAKASEETKVNETPSKATETPVPGGLLGVDYSDSDSDSD